MKQDKIIEAIKELREKFTGGIHPKGTMVLPGEHRTWYPNDAILEEIDKVLKL